MNHSEREERALLLVEKLRRVRIPLPLREADKLALSQNPAFRLLLAKLHYKKMKEQGDNHER